MSIPAICSGEAVTIKNPTDIPSSAITMPSRMAQRVAGSGMAVRSSRMATSRVAIQSTAMALPISAYKAPSSEVVALKWLIVPRAACPTITAISTTKATVITVPSHHPTRRPRVSSDNIQVRARA